MSRRRRSKHVTEAEHEENADDPQGRRRGRGPCQRLDHHQRPHHPGAALTDDRLLDAIQTIAERENELLERNLMTKVGELEARVNLRLATLERKVELPRKVTALGLTLAGFVGGTVGTAVINRLIGGG